MKSFIAAGLAATALASPLARRQASSNIDVTVLQFALTLEHLENVFYQQALKNYTEADFAKAGYGSDYYNNLKYVAYDEQQHVKLLTGAIAATGAKPVDACTYSFPSTDVKSFISLSSVLEGVGTSAYLGGAPLITSKGYLTVAGSILVTEALHTSFQRNAVGEVPFANPYGTPLDPTSVFTLAAAFIVKCPTTNAALPFTPFPSLAYTPATTTKRDAQWGGWGGNYGGNGGNWGGNYGHPAPASPTPAAPTTPVKAVPLAIGSVATFTTKNAVPAGSYVTFVGGLAVVSVKGTVKGNTISAAIPAAVAGGQVYAFISKSDQETTFSDAAVVAGPAIIEVAPPAPTLDGTQ